MNKIEKIFLSALLLSLIPPFAFPHVETIHYSHLGDKTYITPDIDKLGYSALILIAFALYEIWKKPQPEKEDERTDDLGPGA